MVFHFRYIKPAKKPIILTTGFKSDIISRVKQISELSYNYSKKGDVEMSDDEEKWQDFVDKAFKVIDLPEVDTEDLEVGTYTNAQIAEHFRKNSLGLVSLLDKLPGSSVASRRSILSFVVDML